MWYRAIWLMSCCCFSVVCSANELKTQAEQGLQRFITALKTHDLKTLQQLMVDEMTVNVLWLDAEPVQKFTLTKADYLQQAKATWRFASQESYEMSNLVWNEQAETGTVVAKFTNTEKRVILQSATGQKHQLEMSWALVNGSPRIVHINTKVSMW